MFGNKSPWFYYFFTALTVITWSLFSFSRHDFFLEHFEIFNSSQLALVATLFSLFFLLYCLLYTLPPLRRGAQWFILAVAIIATLTPPLLSRDAAGYLVGSNLLFSQQLNPYQHTLADEQGWSRYLGDLWWLDVPFSYGPTMLLITALPIIFSFSNIFIALLLFKFLILATAIASFILFRNLRRQADLPESTDWLFICNPALWINLLYEGHNEIFIIFLLLLFLTLQNRPLKASLTLVTAIFIKYIAIIFLPLTWFSQSRFSWRRFFTSSLIIGIAFFFFFVLIRVSPLDFITRLVFFVSDSCFYKCSPLISVFSSIKNYSLLIKTSVFLIAYAGTAYFFLFKKYSAAAFIFWSGLALFFIETQWLTPWYPCLLIPFALLLPEKKYRLAVILLTAYCLFHYLAWV